MDAPKDDLKWFGKGFDGFPKRFPEDTVEYTLVVVNDSLKQKEVLSRLEEVKKAATSLTNSLLRDYIWQREAFDLKLVQTPELIYLHGLTNYGDSIEDEWLIVYLLRELSSQFAFLWIKIVDTDGEFLLIEAAASLPRWLNPEVADNRVWLNSSHLKIIPTSDTSPGALTQPEALAIISKSPSTISSDEKVESEAFFRLRNYPGQIKDSLHHSLITIPRKLAYIIHTIPAVIAPAVEAFYLRDPIGLKPLLSPSPSTPPTFPPTELVTVSVRFTKVLFAQLKSQQFEALPAWAPLLSSAEKSGSRKDVERLEMGMKVTTGFELLAGDGIKRDQRSVRVMSILLEDLSEGEPLPSNREIAGWLDVERDDDESWLDINFEEFEKELDWKRGPAASATETKQAFGPERPPAADAKGKGKEKASEKSQPDTGFGDAKTQADLKKMVERFEAFLADDKAGIDGAELDSMDYDDDDEESEPDSGSDSEEDEATKELGPKLDPKEFAKLMRRVMGLGMEGLEGDGDFDALGRVAQRMEGGTIEEVDSSADEADAEDEAQEFKDMMAAMDAELRSSGALDLDPKPAASSSKPSLPSAASPRAKPRVNLAPGSPPRTPVKGQMPIHPITPSSKLASTPLLSSRKPSYATPRKESARVVSRVARDITLSQKEINKTRHRNWDASADEDEDDDSDDEELDKVGETEEGSDEGSEVDIDFNLAKNLLESFKGQAGQAGPAGNMLGMMGMKLPRDEGEEEEEEREVGRRG